MSENRDGARVIQVIETTLLHRGSGKDASSPLRSVRQYWSLDGRLLAEVDPCAVDSKHYVMWKNAAGTELLCQPHFDPNIAANFGPLRWQRVP